MCRRRFLTSEHVKTTPGGDVDALVTREFALPAFLFGTVLAFSAVITRLLGVRLGLVRGDSLSATDALLELVDRPAQIDERELERTLGELIVRYAAPGFGWVRRRSLRYFGS